MKTLQNNSGIRPGRRAANRPAFTLVELLVVMGVIVLIVAAAVPAINALSGSRSIQACQNTISAMLSTARAQAMGLQQNTGVVFFYDLTTKRMVMGLVVKDPNGTGANASTQIDLVSDYELEPLPIGVGIQFLYSPNPSGANLDRYISTPGLIMFNGRGSVMYTRFDIRRLGLLGTRMGLAVNFPNPGNLNVPMSQVGIVLFDPEAFNGQGFDPASAPGSYVAKDLVFGGAAYGGGNGTDENSEEKWLDANSTMLLINRYNGTFMRSEPQ